MKKRRLLSLTTAVLMGMSLCLAACGDGDTDKHDHVWDEGEITEAATCYKEGTKTFHCTVEGCEQTKTEPVQKTAHSWDAGTQTKAPKCNEEGETTYACTNEGCTATRTEPIEKTAHTWDQGVITTPSDFDKPGVRTYTCTVCPATRTEAVDAYADFAEQFGTENWHYGTASGFDGEIEDFTFTEVEGQTAITKDKVTVNGVVAVGYTFGENLPENCKAAFTVKFAGSVHAYIVFKTSEGITSIQPNTEAAAVDFTADVEEDARYVQEGDSIYLVLSGENAEGALSFRLYAPCLHVWDSGEVTQEPTCSVPGEKTYTCVNDGCEETYTEEIPTTEHNWNAGEVTKEPTEEEEGVRTFTCTECGAARTESIPKLEHDEYEKIANFGDDFAATLAGTNTNWSVGMVNYDWDNEDFTVTALTKGAEAFTNADPWVELKGDWMATNTMVALGYTFEQAGEINFVFTLNFLLNSKFTVRWALKGENGTIKTNDGKTSWGGEVSPIKVDEKLTVAAGDTLYVLINKEDTTDNQCSFTFEIKAKEETPAPQGSVSFGDDFAATLAGTNTNWSVGTVDYIWADEDFTFTALTQKTDEAFKQENPWVEIKGDWMAIQTMVGIAYKFDVAGDAHFDFHLNGVAADSAFTVRWALKSKDGTIKTDDGKAKFVGNAKELSVSQDLEVAADDVLYIVVQKEADPDQCNFTFEIKAKEETPAPQTAVSFGDDFDATLAGTSNWSVGMVNYDWDNEDFTVTALTKGTEAFTSTDPWVELKGDWMATNAMVALGYKFDVAGNVHFDFHLEASSKFSIRWALKSADGTIKNIEGNPVFVGNDKELSVSQDLEVAAGDVLYVLVQKEEEPNQCTFNFTVSTDR